MKAEVFTMLRLRRDGEGGVKWNGNYILNKLDLEEPFASGSYMPISTVGNLAIAAVLNVLTRRPPQKAGANQEDRVTMQDRPKPLPPNRPPFPNEDLPAPGPPATPGGDVPTGPPPMPNEDVPEPGPNRPIPSR